MRTQWLMNAIAILAVMLGITIAPASAATLDVTTYGAVPNDGGDDLAAINSAIAAASAGDTVYFPGGTFNISGTVAGKSGVRLEGAAGSVLLYGGSSSGAVLTLHSVSNATVIGLTLDGNLTARQGIFSWSGSNLLLQNLTVKNIRSADGDWENAGIFFNGTVTDCTITNNTLTNIGTASSYGTGIRLAHGASRNVVEGNTISNTGRGGILCNDDSTDLVIRNNTITGSGMTTEGLGIELWGRCHRAVVEDNTIDHWLSLDSSDYCAIRRNTVSGPGSAWAGLEGITQNSVFADNTVNNGAADIGISISNDNVNEHVLWTRNTIQDCLRFAAQLQPGSGGCSYQYFYQNKFNSTRAGIQGDGIRFQKTDGDSQYLSFESNEISYNARDGLSSYGGRTLNYVSFTNNTIVNNGNGGGEWFDVGADLEWSGNTIFGNHGGDAGYNNQKTPSGFTNQKPEAAFTCPATAAPGVAVSFTNTSSDPGGSIGHVLWDFGDGVPSTDMNPTHTYANPGTYTVSLVVWDNLGRGKLATQNLTVAEPILAGREEQVIYPSGNWEYANTGTRDVNVLPVGGWSSTDPLYPNLYWQRLTLALPLAWSSKRVSVHVGACAFYVRAYLNGNYVGEHYGPATPFDADITPYINWAGTNVLMLAVQDFSALLNLADKSNNGYQYADAPDPSMQGPMPFAVWMYNPRLWTADIKLQAFPKVRVTDVFVRPSVRQWKLDVDLTLRNDDTVSHSVSIEDSVTKWNQTAVEKSFTPSSVTVGPGATVITTVTVPWTDPILWSPNQPQLYTLTTTLKDGAVTMDSLTTRFGFREFWVQKSADNTRSWFVLNGVRQNLRGEGVWSANLGDAFVSTFIDWLKTNNYNCVRICSGGKGSYYDLADEKGILVQSEVPFNFKQKYTYDATFWSRAQTYLTDQIKAWRNHPSIVFWGVENEVMLCSQGEAIGDNLLSLEAAALALDPTRPAMHEGDGDLRTLVKNTPSSGKNVQVVNIHNYDLAQPSRNVMWIMDFPNAAYVFGETTDATILPGYSFGTAMPDQSKPWYIGEFGAGCVLANPQYLALHNGDSTYVDIFGQATGLMTAMGTNYAFQIDGYRYFDWICGIAPWATYSGDPSIGDGPLIAAAFKPVTTRIKELTHNFYDGDTITRTLTVYNDDVSASSSFNLHWRLVDGAQDLLSGDWNFVSQPGFMFRDTLSFTAPAVSSRLNVTLVLELRISGVLADTTTQALSIFPARGNVTMPAGLPVYVYDPSYPSSSNIVSVLNSLGVSYTRVYSLKPAAGWQPGLYIIGHAAYPNPTPAATITAIQTWIRNGGTLLVNGDQWTAPQWLSWYGDATWNITDYWYDYTIGFLRAPNHPILAGLQTDDCKWWGPNHYITHTGYTNGTWSKPSAGLMNVLVDTGGRNQGLDDSPLCEYPDGKGSTIVNRLRIFDDTTSAKEPVSRFLLQNILNYANTVRQRVTQKGLGVLSGTGSATPTVLTRIKIPCTSLTGQLATYTAASLSHTFNTIMIDNDATIWTEVDANRATLQTFVSNGGRIILRKIDSSRVGQASSLTGVAMSTKATQLQHPQLEKKTADPVMDGISNDDVWWVHTGGNDPIYWYRQQEWASAIVTDVISVAESSTVMGLLVEPNRTGVLQTDSGQSYALGAAERNASVAISQPGFGLVRINPASGTGYYLVDQLLWDAAMDTQLTRKAQRYLATLLTHSLDTLPLEVTVNQAAGQADPTNISPINFTVVFNKPVADFTNGGVIVTGTGGGTKTATVSGSGMTYNVAVTGMASAGTVIAEIAAGAAHDADGNANLASTSTDNSVVYNPPPTITEGDSVTVTMSEDSSPTPFSLTLHATDPDNETLSWSIKTQAGFGMATGGGSGTSKAVTYVPSANVNGSDSFVVQVADPYAGADTITVNVSVQPVNDVPMFTKGANRTVGEDSGVASVVGWATAINDGDPEVTQTISFIVSSDNPALFSIQPAVAANGTLTFTPAPDANGSATVQVQVHDSGGTDNGGVDTSAVQMFTITVNPVNDAPVMNSAKTPVLTAENEDSGTPVGVAGTLISALIDLTVSAGDLDNVTDPDSGALPGIAVTAADTTNGSWYYSLDNGTTWLPLGTPSNSSARLLPADAGTRLFFQPTTANWNGTITGAITFRAWDRTTGSNGSTADTAVNGGATAFSTVLDTAAITVTAVNDAPVLNAGKTPVLASVAEDAQAPQDGEAVGTLVSSLVDFASPAGQADNVTDPDSGALLGIAITGADTANGIWHYTTDAGAHWSLLGTPSGVAARLLAADGSARLYFQPTTADWNGAITGALTFRAWDQTAGSNGGTADTAVNGGTTAFSTVTDTAAIMVTAVNDAPVLDAGKSPVMASVAEDAAAPIGTVGTLVSSLVDFASPPGQVDNVTDVDSGALTGIAVMAADTGKGTWYYSLNNGTTWLALGTPANSATRLLAADATTRLFFRPTAANWNGTVSDIITFRAWDRTGGSNGGTADTTVNGGTTAFSIITDTADLTVTPVNDAPVLDAGKSPVMMSVAEDAQAPQDGEAAGTLISTLVDLASPAGGLDNVTETDGVALLGIAITAADTSKGTWYWSLDNGATWLALGTPSNSTARLLPADTDTRLFFQPTTVNWNGTVSDAITFRAWDRTVGTAGSTADTTTNGGSTSFSTTIDTAAITVTPVNDAPVLDSARTPVLTAENEDPGMPAGAVGTVVSSLVDFARPTGQVDNVTDPDSGALHGIAVTGAETTNGIWYWSVDNGATWLTLGTPSDAAARLLAADGNTRLYFQPAPDFSGTIPAALTFRAWDQTGGSNGGTADTTVNGGTTAFSTAADTAGLTVSPVNDAPVLDSARTPVMTAENEDPGLPAGAVGTLVSSLVDFASPAGQVDNITEPDNGALPGIAVTAADTTNGSWYCSLNNGTTWLTLGTPSNTAARLLPADAGSRLFFQPNANWNGTVTEALTFRAWDRTTGSIGGTANTAVNGGSTAFSTATDSAAITVNPVSDAPVLDAGKSPVMATVAEDTRAPQAGEATGTLISSLVDFAGDSAGLDNVTDPDSGALLGIAITGADATHGAWYFSPDNGATWLALGTPSNSTARLLAADAATRLFFQPTTANWNGTITGALAFRAWDRTVGTADSTADTTTNGGSTSFSTAIDTAAITVTPVNDAPVLDSARTPVLTAENEDPGTPAGAVGTRVSSLVDLTAPAGGLDNVTDIDNGALTGIAVTGADTASGTWYWSADNGTTWTALGTPTAAAARLLGAATGRLFFQPAPDFNGTITTALSFRAWDQSAGTAGSTADTAVNGGATAFSAAIDTADLTVAPVNDAPVLDAAKSPVLTAEDEDPGMPAGAVGTLVSSLVDFASPAGQVDNLAEVDSGALLGIAVTATDTGKGFWYYSLNNGTTWLTLGTPSDTAARLLPADAGSRLFFQPNANWNGTVTEAVTFRAWDRTSGSNGGTANTAANGGTTAFSTTTDTASLTVTPVNDAPVLDAAKSPVMASVAEDAAAPDGAVGTLISVLVDLAAPAGGLDNVTDPDIGARLGIAVTGTDASNGTWYWSTDNGGTWLALGTPTAAAARLLAADAGDRLYFHPAADWNGVIAGAVTFRAWDRTAGTAGGTADTTVNGGSTAFSTAADTAGFTVTPVNDAPVLDSARTPVMTAENEDQGMPAGTVGTRVSSLIDFAVPAGQVDNVTDPDREALLGIAVIGADTANGSWYWSIDNGTTWTALGVPTAGTARLLVANVNNRLFFQPAPEFNGTVTAALTFRAWDRTSGTAGSTADATVNGGSTAFSTAFDTADLTVTAAAHPQPPAGVAASDGTDANAVHLLWTAAAPGVTGYEVWRGTGENAADANLLATVGADQTNYDDTTAAAETVYFYWVKTEMALGVSAFGTPDSGWRGWLFAIALTHADKDAVEFGMLAGATNGYDAAFDVQSPPAPAPGMPEGGIYFLDAGGVLYQRNMHADAEADTWTLKVVANRQPIPLSWAADTIPAGRQLSLREVNSTGATIPGTLLNLATTAMLNVPAQTVKHYVIAAEPAVAPQAVRLALAQGWNLISLPVEPADPAVGAVLGTATRDGTRSMVSPATAWRYVNSGTGAAGYEPVDEMHALVGYWVRAPVAATIQVTGMPLTAIRAVALHEGWNLIGPAADVGVPRDASLRGLVWWWDAAADRYFTLDPVSGVLAAGYGYWLFIKPAADLDLGR